MGLITKLDIGILNFIASIILFVASVVVALYAHKIKVEDKSLYGTNFSSVGVIMCICTAIIMCLMGINLIVGVKI